MRGFPRYLNTPQDIQNCLLLYPVEAKRYIDMIYRDRYLWSDYRVLGMNEPGIVDDDHAVVTREIGGTVQRVQLKRVEDPNALIWRLGLSREQVKEIIGAQQAEEETGGI